MHRAQFPLFQTPLDLAHAYWKTLLKPGDIAIDATCGNGHDTLFLANIVLAAHPKGQVIAIDSQEEALERTRKRINDHIHADLQQHVHYYRQSHATFPKNVSTQSVGLIVYNLGYLPGSDKSITTMHKTTLASVENALPLIAPGCVLSITCYPGHAEGKIEEEALLAFTQGLDPFAWSCCHHKWTNRRDAPSLLILQKAML